MSVGVDALVAGGVATLAPLGECARGDALFILASVVGKNRAWIVAHGDATIGSEHRAEYERLCRMRATGMPVAYALGRKGFYGRDFAVDERVLVPRPETEHVVEAALTHAAGCDAREIRVLDVGTGCGAIGVTLAAEHPRIVVDAVDVSPDALEVAGANARSFGVASRCRFHLGRFAEPVAGRCFDIVVANLPYVATAEIPARPDPLAFEPRLALDGGPDGLDAYRALLPQLAGLLLPRGIALMEGSPEQMPALAALAGEALEGARIAIGSDYAGRERFLRVDAAG